MRQLQIPNDFAWKEERFKNRFNSKVRSRHKVRSNSLEYEPRNPSLLGTPFFSADYKTETSECTMESDLSSVEAPVPEEKSASDAISSLISGIQSFLRYFAPGFVALGLLLLTSPPVPESVVRLVRERPENELITGIILGLAINSIHVAWPEDLLACLVLYLYPLLRICNPTLPPLPPEVHGMRNSERFREIETRRLLRRASKPESQAKRFQDSQDSFGATLTFLYCSSYPGTIIALWQFFLCQHVSRVAWLSGLVLFLFGLACDFRYTGLDIWAYKTLRTEVEGADAFAR